MLYGRLSAYNLNNSGIDPHSALTIFERKGLGTVKEIICGDYKLITFNKRSFENKNFFGFDNGDFVASTGTPLYKNQSGEKAAAELYSDFRKNIKIDFRNFFGHFCYIVYINDKLFLFNDYNGLYQVYYDLNERIFSNSFLAVSNSLKNKTISNQGMYEYILYGATFGRDTIIENIKQLTNKKILQLKHKVIWYDKLLENSIVNGKLEFDDWIENISADLIDYFKVITKNYDRFSLGLSGGFDSRLVLSLLLNLSIKPSINTHGKQNSAEVKISKSICEAYGLEFDNYDNEVLNYHREYLNEFIKNKFYLDEGFDLSGIFKSTINKNLEMSQRGVRTNLSGVGGEIYRSFWNLPDKKVSIDNLINLKWNDFNNQILKGNFNKSAFFENFALKISNSIDVEKSYIKLPSSLINLIYSNFRIRYLAAKTCPKNNQYCFALVPFSEPTFYLKSIYLPSKFKISGKFEAALIKKINPELSKFNSIYGFNFYDGPPIKLKFLDVVKMHVPGPIRILIRKKAARKILTQLDSIKEIEKIVFKKELLLNKYFNLNKISNKDMYSRALTLEYFWQNCM